MISTLQKRLQYVLLSLAGPSISFRIESHIGRETCFGGLMVEMSVVVCGTLARQDLPKGYGDHQRMVAWVLSSFQPSNHLLQMAWASFYRLKGHHSGKTVITH